MIYGIPPLAFAGGMLAGMLLCLEAGRRLGLRWHAKNSETSAPALGTLEGAVFGLFGLLMAFTFSGAPSRLDARRELIADEVNAIETAYLRLDLLSPESRSAMRDLFRSYVDSRVEVYRQFPDIDAVKEKLGESREVQLKIWEAAVVATRMPDIHPEAGRQLLPALNSMIEITTTRTMAAMIHPPPIIFAFLFFLALVSSLLAGYGLGASRARSWLHYVAFVSIVVITVYIIIEIEFPRSGYIRMEAFDAMLADLRKSMG